MEDASRYNNFDIIRILAALQVLQEHTASWLSLPRPAWFAYAMGLFPGVPIFFIVSGFLVTKSFLSGAGGPSSYFARRALRIYPALWVNIAAIVLLLAITGSLLPQLTVIRLLSWFGVACGSGADIYANFAVGSIVDPDGFYPFFPSMVLWTIPVELGFYVILPLIVGPARRFGTAAVMGSLVVWAIVSLAVMYAYAHLETTRPESLLTKALSVTTMTYLWYFLIGAVVLVSWGRLRRLFEGQVLLWLILHLAVAGADALLFGNSSIDFHAITPLLPLHVVTLAGVVFSFAYSWRTMGRVMHGIDPSYGVYLNHVPVILTLKYAGLSLGVWWWPTIVILTLGIAIASWLLIERPALTLKATTDRWFAPAA